MAEAGARIRALRASGGGARDRLWPQIVSDVTQLPQKGLAETTGAAYGDALLAAIATGAAGLDTVWATEGMSLIPDPAGTAQYDELYELFRELYPATVTQAHALAALQRRAHGPESHEVG
jgi:xylulokinase